MIDQFKIYRLAIAEIKEDLIPSLGSRIDYIEDSLSACIAPELSKSTHNTQQWCLSHIKRLDQITPEILHDIDRLDFIYAEYLEESKNLQRTRVFFKNIKLRKLKQMNENLQNAIEILGDISEKFSANEEVSRLIQEKLPGYTVKLIDAKNAIMAGTPDLNGDGKITTLEQMAYDVGKPIIEKAIKNAQQDSKNPPSKVTFWLDRAFKVISGLGWIIFLILQIIQYSR